MNNIVIAFPKKEVANSIKKILAQSGYTVTAVANTGASALSSMNGLNIGNHHMRIQYFRHDVQ